MGEVKGFLCAPERAEGAEKAKKSIEKPWWTRVGCAHPVY